MPWVEFKFDAYCTDCGRKLESDGKDVGEIQVQPCQVCFDERYEEGLRDGKEAKEAES